MRSTGTEVLKCPGRFKEISSIHIEPLCANEVKKYVDGKAGRGKKSKSGIIFGTVAVVSCHFLQASSGRHWDCKLSWRFSDVIFIVPRYERAFVVSDRWASTASRFHLVSLPSGGTTQLRCLFCRENDRLRKFIISVYHYSEELDDKLKSGSSEPPFCLVLLGKLTKNLPNFPATLL